ncbi:flagellar biosynthesis protein FlhA [Cellulomonas fimi]|uniref:Flagellar biosynthesis protein FlhA n=1 Tax=Cellulomonas fimi (strain ATCC 484 / DSM 20113 / JCM 1341 / CCUG 24087 / LMG 16345 / NBRC 15513 / NCIMB 8980 / NCTC 7547 / NRS-133) TaxID=590998 RepID=F4GZB3_CELFA|nr:flagellar biosynthesis protein FlhA [Cellulomonas fimi]AEE44834.1 flagellar biosynthesis protein FlhA [Cellulomonas fimi ATCC 484]NNH08351.1 flagellar biosynthesis protein FlhA [Cellulomonas fimi]VEH27427.1 Flagellar biosynthesis protein flhA [Cellulomonas fimi]
MKSRSIAPMAVPAGVVGIVLLLVVPLPAALLDVLIAVNITASLVILLTSMYVKRPLDFSVFPSLILVFTLFRLGLNVASTRLVLRDGYAGQVIEAFGHFVIGGSLVIGLVIFLILVVIQFAVITNGAGRVAEVGARFTLDAMPGKQMAIDADLNSGLIDEDEARRRRADVAAEADFYGAMDGGSKFVKGDAIAGIIITVINLVGGFVIGMVQMGMSAGESLQRFSLLTIGDGLVTQIPALLLSVSTGIVVTRATAEGDMGTAAAKQLGQSRTALLISGGAAVALALLPGMPKLPFLLVGATLILVAQRVKAREQREADAAAATPAAAAVAAPSDTPEQLIEQMRVHTLEILLAPDLVDLVGTGPDQDLLARVRGLRRKTAMELGIVVPPVRTRDSVDLPRATYVVKIAGVEVGRGEAPAGYMLALGDDLSALPGTTVHEPVFGLPGKWVPSELRHAAEMSGATVVDRVSVLITHLGALITQNAARLLGREDVRVLTESVKKVNPSVVEELVPSLLSLGEVQRVLQGLLTEEVPIRDLGRIYEALALRAKLSTDPEGLVEAARGALGPALAAPYVQDGVLRVLTLDPALEQTLVESLRPGDGGTQLLVDPTRVEAVLHQLRAAVADAEGDGRTVVLVCAPVVRPALRRLVALGLPRLPVLSYAEVTGGGLTVETVGVVRGDHAIAA